MNPLCFSSNNIDEKFLFLISTIRVIEKIQLFSNSLNYLLMQCFVPLFGLRQFSSIPDSSPETIRYINQASHNISLGKHNIGDALNSRDNYPLQLLLILFNFLQEYSPSLFMVYFMAIKTVKQLPEIVFTITYLCTLNN